MLNLSLSDITFVQLDATSWCTTATVSSVLVLPSILWYDSCQALAPFTTFCHNTLKDLTWQRRIQANTLSFIDIARHKRQQQRHGVRQLLKHLLTNLAISDMLDDSKFPYQLADSGYYVCFSHSDDHTKRSIGNIANTNYLLTSQVAVAISYHRSIGIDIEMQSIAWATVQRYYHANEISALNKMPKQQRQTMSKSLWQIKECFIKIYNYKLTQGLGFDYSPLIPQLLTSHLSKPDKLSIITPNSATNKTKSYQIAIMVQAQTSVVF